MQINIELNIDRFVSDHRMLLFKKLSVKEFPEVNPMTSFYGSISFHSFPIFLSECTHPKNAGGSYGFESSFFIGPEVPGVYDFDELGMTDSEVYIQTPFDGTFICSLHDFLSVALGLAKAVVAEVDKHQLLQRNLVTPEWVKSITDAIPAIEANIQKEIEKEKLGPISKRELPFWVAYPR